MSSEFIAKQQLSLGVREALVPTGALIMWQPPVTGVGIPPGYIEAAGQTVFTADYPNLARFYGAVGDETFTVPNHAHYIQKV